MKADTIFRIASMSDPVATRPGEGVTPTRAVAAERPITIQHLLTHTAGLPNTYTGRTELMTTMAGERKPTDAITDMTKRPAA